MPANNFNYRQDDRSNFDAVRPAPIYTDDQQAKGGFHNIHVSTNFYHGYHNLQSSNNHVDTDCEMADVAEIQNSATSKMKSKKRSAEEQYDVQTKRGRDVETATKLGMEASCLELGAQCDEIRFISEGMVPSTSSNKPEVQNERNIVPETNETMKLDTTKEDFIESLYWNLHGGNIFQLIQ